MFTIECFTHNLIWDHLYPSVGQDADTCESIGRASLAFVLRDVARFTVLSPRLVQ